MTAAADSLAKGGIYALTPPYLSGDELYWAVFRALAGGVGMIQYRAKQREAAYRRLEAEALLRLCRRRRIPLIINDDTALAVAIGADGVHLGRDDGAIEDARRRLGADAIIGASCYADLQRAAAARDAGASYLAFGSIFTSATKPQAPPCGLEILRQARREFDLPIVAIGGISIDNGAEALAAGAHWLAVIDGIFAGKRITERSAALVKLTVQAGGGPGRLAGDPPTINRDDTHHESEQ